MRIIAGSARGTKLTAPEGLATRPVLDRVKESWFAVLVSRLGGGGIEGARVLDLYAGVGSLGLEALSRGAASCLFVEADAECVAFLDGNLARAGLARGASVRRSAVEDSLPALAREGALFDLVFVDPPFELARDKAFWSERGAVATAAKLLDPAACGHIMVRCEARPRGRPAAAPEVPGLVLRDGRAWGRNQVLFFERPAPGGEARSRGTAPR